MEAVQRPLRDDWFSACLVPKTDLVMFFNPSSRHTKSTPSLFLFVSLFLSISCQSHANVTNKKKKKKKVPFLQTEKRKEWFEKKREKKCSAVQFVLYRLCWLGWCLCVTVSARLDAALPGTVSISAKRIPVECTLKTLNVHIPRRHRPVEMQRRQYITLVAVINALAPAPPPASE